MSFWIPGQPEPEATGGRWRKAKMHCLVRDNFRCQHPGCKCKNIVLLTVHHVVAKSEGGAKYDLTNLITLCQFHHALLHGMLPKEARAYSIVALEQTHPEEQPKI